MLCGLCVDRRVLAVLIASATVAAQDVPITRQITLTLTEGTSMAAAVSPDRRSIAIDLLGSLWVLPIRGGEAKRITPELLEARQPTWSPDSQSIAFQGYEDGTWHIYVINRDGGDARAVTHGEFDDREPAWSHDGSRIAFSSDRYGGISTIWEVGLAGGALRRATTRGGSMPAWSPNDDEIAFVSQDRERSGPTDIRDSVPGLVGGERRRGVNGWCSTRSGTACRRARRGVPTARGSRTRWPADTSASTARRQAAPTRMCSRSGQAGSRAPSSSTPPTATSNGSRSTGRPPSSRSPPRCRCSAARFRSRTACSSLPGHSRVAGLVKPVVSPDGRTIAFTAIGDLWLLPVGGTPVQMTNDAAFEVDPAWSPDSTQLAFVSDRGGHMDLWVRDLRASKDTQVTRERAAVSGPAWSRDGSQIAYLGDRHELRTVRIKPGDCRGGATRGRHRRRARPARRGRPAAGRSPSARCFPTRIGTARG